MPAPARRNHATSGRSRTWRSYALAAAAAATLLAATACDSDGSDARDDARPSDRASATASTHPPGTGPASSGAATPAGDGGDGGDTSLPTCTDDDLTASATSEDGQGRQPRHLLIVLTNSGGKKCDLYHYPYVRLGAYSRSPVPVIAASDPGAPVTLAPGDDAYAALLVNAGAMDTYETKAVTLRLQDRREGSTTGDPISVELPAVAAFDDGARVTCWTTAQGYALDFVMSS